MHCKNACLIINPRDGQNLAKITNIIAVLSAAGWSTDIAIKEYGGHSMELATRAAKQDYDLILAYGGDGTLNQVVNGVMNSKGQHSIVGTIPGGTVNEWASEITLPSDPVKAALALVNSNVRKIDIGHVEVELLTFPAVAQGDQEQSPTNGSNGKKPVKKAKPTPKAKHHFLLMAGLGIDAAIMSHVNKTLKHSIGVAAVGLTAGEVLPEQHPFPVEIRETSNGNAANPIWRGEALQVVIGNTRRYAGIVEMTADAFIDDGILDICVITAGDPLSTMQQITSLLFRRKLDNRTAEYFRGAHLSISVPASIALQLDGTTVKLKDYLTKSDSEALQHERNSEHVMVNYRFDSLPKALKVAFPHSYDETLFEKPNYKALSQAGRQHQAIEGQSPSAQQYDFSGHNDRPTIQEQQKSLEDAQALLPQGRKVTVMGVVLHPDKKQQTYIIAGAVTKPSTGEVKPVAVCINGRTTAKMRTGENASLAILEELQEGGEFLVEGRKSKRGVIRAKRVVV